MRRVLLRVLPLFAGLIGTASSLAAQPLPAPTNPNLKHFGYYHADGRELETNADHTAEVFPYTNLYVAVPNVYNTNSNDWQTPFRASIENAVEHGKMIYLTMNKEGPPRNINWDAILNIVAHHWANVAYVEVAHESNLSRAEMEDEIQSMRDKVAAKGLTGPQLYGAMFGTDEILDTDALDAVGLDFAGIEAYVPFPFDDDSPDNLPALNTYLTNAKNRVRAAGKKAVLVMQAFDRNGEWDNIETLTALQAPVYLQAKDDTVVVAITMFAYMRIGGTREYPQLRAVHRRIACAMTLITCKDGDYDGDGDADLAVYRPTTGQWFVRNQLAVQFGDPGDKPVPADYDGDGALDVAVYRPSTGTWFVRNQSVVQFGDPGDIPVPADYNGDGRADVAVWRPSTGVWYVRNLMTVQFGDPADVPLPGDYNGDGFADIAVYRPSTAMWFVKDQFYVQHGTVNDLPVPADYDGDGDTDVAVYQPAAGNWWVRSQLFVQFGEPGDLPVPGDYNKSGTADVAVYRPSTGTWYVRNQFVVQFGDPGDVPVVKRGGS